MKHSRGQVSRAPWWTFFVIALQPLMGVCEGSSLVMVPLRYSSAPHELVKNSPSWLGHYESNFRVLFTMSLLAGMHEGQFF
jgi:hypothetical protein